MADPERTAKLRAQLVRLRSVDEVDTISVRDRKSVDGLFDAVKDIISVTHRTVAVRCTELLNVCGEEPFRTDLRLLRSVLERGCDKVSKSRNVGLAPATVGVHPARSRSFPFFSFQKGGGLQHMLSGYRVGVSTYELFTYVWGSPNI